jgi:hypothetical protein
MTHDDDFIGQLEGYLDEYEGVTPLPDAARNVVRAQLPMTKQLGPIRGPMRYLRMQIATPVRSGLAAVFVAAVVIAGAVLIGFNYHVGPHVGATPSPSASQQSSLPSPNVSPTPVARPASWRPTGSMITARTNGIPHTLFIATLLHDGTALVTGGYDPIPLADSELYDPKSGQWTATGDLITARRRHSVTLLPDGRVLVAAGLGPDGLLASAEVYDPLARTWAPTGRMHSAREGHIAVALLDGRVLVIGGTATPSAELYDPSSGTWTTTGAPDGSLFSANTPTVLTNGDVLLVGLETEAQVYHPGSGSWAATGQMIERRAYHAATLLTDGRVLVAAGWIGGPVISSAEIYDPRTGTWSATGSLSQNLEPNAAMVLADGSVLVIQGDMGERYDPLTGQWRIAPEMPPSLGGSAAVLLADGTVLIAGGGDPDGGTPSTSAYIYDPGFGN